MKPGRSRMDVGIIGAGWSGLAAAVELTRSGHRVTIYESARLAGGRARRVETNHLTLDNGQHLLIGAYSETLRLMDTVKPGSSTSGFLRLPLTLDYPDGVKIRAPRLTAPFHLGAALLLARGFSFADKLAAIRFVRSLERMDFCPDSSLNVAEAIATQPERVRRYLWQSLCIAALNTPVEQASFAVFARVLKDALTGQPANSDLLIPVCDLSALFPEPAMEWIRQQGGEVRLCHRIKSIQPGNGGWQVHGEEGTARHDAVIIATSPHQASALLEGLPECRLITDQIKGLSYQPIETVYAEYPRSLRFRYPLTGWIDPVPLFLFDLEAAMGRTGWVAAVASAEGPHLDWEDGRWLDEIHQRVEQALGPQPAPRLLKRITEKRATFSCAPGVSRPASVTPSPGLYLAGDYVDGPYPSTLEGAVRSGVQCALQLLNLP